MDSLFSASPVVRRAVADLIFGLPNQNLDISLAVKRGTGERIVSSLSVGQSESLRERLDIIREEREIVRIQGRLDGLRTRRQILISKPEPGWRSMGSWTNHWSTPSKQILTKRSR